MTFDCPTPNDISPVLIGEFVEIQKGISEEQRFIETIRATTRERLVQMTCDIDPKQRKIAEKYNKETLKQLVARAKSLEQEIAHAIFLSADKETRTGLVSWSVGNGTNLNNLFFQKVLALYELRYGTNETTRIADIFSDADNDGKYKMFIEYHEIPTKKGIYIRRIWLRDIEAERMKEEKKDAPPEKGSNGQYLEPIAQIDTTA